MSKQTRPDFTRLAQNIKSWGKDLGFQQVGISACDLNDDFAALERWLAKGYHGSMEYMARHRDKRQHPMTLHPDTRSIIAVRMNYAAANDRPEAILSDAEQAYVARYALGRDYHKVIRARLRQLANKIDTAVEGMGYRAFTDSAPLLERAIAEQAGLGWIGKNTMLINRQAGSQFFLGELLTTLPLPPDSPVTSHCGSCRACIDVCPTQAIVAPYQLDARRCIAYLTIENKGPIPTALRPLIGNRIFGCDDCQLICPWNKFTTPTTESDFSPRNRLNHIDLLSLWEWDETTFLQRTEGSAIRRAGYIGWLRNLAVALGNAPASAAVRQALATKSIQNDMVKEHVAWALTRQRKHINQDEEH